MKVEEINFNAHNGHKIYGDIMFPEGESQGILHIIHGMREHIGRYKEFAAYMTGMGFIVCGCDNAGHGRSAGEGGFGYFGENNGYISLINDVYTMYCLMRERFGDMRYFIMGHSLGSFIARYFCAEFSDKINISGAIFSGTGYMNPVLLKLAMYLVNFSIVLHGTGKDSPFFIKHTFKRYNNQYKSKKSKWSWLSRDIEKVREFEKDELTWFHYTHSGYRDMFAIYRCVSLKQWANKINKDMPIYFFSGDRDPIGKFGKGVTQVCKRLYAAGHKKITLKLYRGGRHEMLNEINRKEVYEDVYNWINFINNKNSI